MTQQQLTRRISNPARSYFKPFPISPHYAGVEQTAQDFPFQPYLTSTLRPKAIRPETFSHHRTSLEVDRTLSLRKAKKKRKKKNCVYLTICIKEQVALWAGPIMRSNVLLLHFRRKKMKCKIYIYNYLEKWQRAEHANTKMMSQQNQHMQGWVCVWEVGWEGEIDGGLGWYFSFSNHGSRLFSSPTGTMNATPPHSPSLCLPHSSSSPPAPES